MPTTCDVTEIRVWRLAHQLTLRVDLFLLSPDFRRHYQQSDRLCDAARSAPRNIAEGFAGERHVFAERLRLAKGSQAEVMTHLSDAYQQRLITLDELQIARGLTRRAINAANGLIRSLEANGAAAPPAKRRSRRRMRSIPTSSD